MGRISPDEQPHLLCFNCEVPLCKTCERLPAEKVGMSKTGRNWYRPNCVTCSQEKYNTKKPHQKSAWKRISKNLRIDSICSACGFEPEHPCQLDVDHIDGDNKNNTADNLQVLCANCHRLKTLKNKDGWYRT